MTVAQNLTVLSETYRYGAWGPKMSEAIILAARLGVCPGPMSPHRFAAAVDDITGIRHPQPGRPEDCAALWLPKLRELARARA